MINTSVTPYYICDKINFPVSLGIYSINFQNSNNSKAYIGSTCVSFKKRWLAHISMLRKNKHFSIKLQNAFNKYGEENLVFSIVECCPKHACLSREQFYIDETNACMDGYNSRPVSENQLGYRHRESTKAKMRDNKRAIKDETLRPFLTIVPEYYNKKFTIKEISALTGLSQEYVSEILENSGISIRPKSFYHKKEVFQYDLHGVLHARWDSTYECSIITGIPHSNIRRSLKNWQQTHGFMFLYDQIEEEIFKEKFTHAINLRKTKRIENIKNSFDSERRKFMSDVNEGNQNRMKYRNIHQYDTNNNLIKIWETVQDIVVFFNLKNGSPITRVILGKREKFKNFYWKCI